LIAALAPPGGAEWDALSYHLTVPKAYLREARVFYVPYDHHSNFPFLLQMLYTLMLGVKSVGGAKLCHWLCGVLLTLSVYTFARRQHPGANGKRLGRSPRFSSPRRRSCSGKPASPTSTSPPRSLRG
jgi:hypothetical protein